MKSISREDYGYFDAPPDESDGVETVDNVLFRTKEGKWGFWGEVGLASSLYSTREEAETALECYTEWLHL